MSDSCPASLPAEPTKRTVLSLCLTALPAPELAVPTRGQRLEFTARGERVPARLLIPSASHGPGPLAIFVHDEMEIGHHPAAVRSLRAGTAVMELNWPLTGARRSRKMSERLLAALAAKERGSAATLLLAQFQAQVKEEFACLLAAADEIEEVDAKRILRLDLVFTPQRAIAACESDEQLAPIGKAIRSHLAGAGVGLGDAQACTTLERYVASLLA